MQDKSADRFQTFVASIGGLAADEARKAKLLYVRNELAEYEAGIQAARAFGFLQLMLVVIPFFWPILLAQRYFMVVGRRLRYRRIRNALDVCSSDLGDQAAALSAKLEELSQSSPLSLLPWRNAT